MVSSLLLHPFSFPDYSNVSLHQQVFKSTIVKRSIYKLQRQINFNKTLPMVLVNLLIRCTITAIFEIIEIIYIKALDIGLLDEIIKDFIPFRITVRDEKILILYWFSMFDDALSRWHCAKFCNLIGIIIECNAVFIVTMCSSLRLPLNPDNILSFA